MCSTLARPADRITEASLQWKELTAASLTRVRAARGAEQPMGTRLAAVRAEIVRGARRSSVADSKQRGAHGCSQCANSA